MSGSTDPKHLALRARFVPMFMPYYRRHARALLHVILAVVLLGYGVSSLEVTAARLLSGIGQLARIVGLMLPPDPGSLATVLVFLKAMAETLAIALLGTLGAALVAFPLGFWRRVTPR